MPLPVLGGTLGYKRAAHLLHRASFGPTRQQIDNFAAMSPSQAVTILFQGPLPTPAPPVDPETGQEWMTSGHPNPERRDSDLQEIFKGWMLAQMLSAGIAPAQSLSYAVREKIVFFLHTLFTTIQEKVDSSRALYFQNQLFRQFAWDKNLDERFTLRELTKKVSLDNAMLRLLDGNLNVKGSPQENYARELFELYSIGRGLEGNLPPITDPGDYFVFREQDVQAAARVLSGWDFDNTFSTLDEDTQLPRGRVRGTPTNASAHDNGVKQFSDRLGGAVIQPDPLLLQAGNATEASAREEISQLIDLIYRQPETPRHICRKIYRYFVYHEITPALDDTIIAAMADTFVAAQYKIQPVLEELFRSQHFYEAAAGNADDNFGAIIKSPLDLQIGTYRLFSVSMPNLATDPGGYYARTQDLIRSLDYMGMKFYQPFDVAGYDAYHQFPIYHRSWITPNYLARRYEFIRELITPGGGGMPSFDVVAFVQSEIPNAVASDARALIIALARYFLPISDDLTFDSASDDNAGITAERLNYFLTAFLKTPQIDADPEAAWSFRWNNPVDMEVVRRQLEGLFNAMLQSPEYQLY